MSFLRAVLKLSIFEIVTLIVITLYIGYICALKLQKFKDNVSSLDCDIQAILCNFALS